MIAEARGRLSETEAKKTSGVEHWGSRRELARSAGTPDVAAHVNIEGLVGRLHRPRRKNDSSRKKPWPSSTLRLVPE